MNQLELLDYIACFNAIFLWFAYEAYALKRQHRVPTLNLVTHDLRKYWMRNFLAVRTNERVADIQLISMLHRGISFFTSITVFIIAGLLAMFASSGTVVSVLERLPFYADNAPYTWNIKIMLLIVIFIVAFFRLTWALRQVQYYSVALFSAPQMPMEDKSQRLLGRRLAKLMAVSGRNFNEALRLYYFGLAMVFWLVDPIFFISALLIVLRVIYRREFHSNTLHMLTQIKDLYEKHDKLGEDNEK